MAAPSPVMAALLPALLSRMSGGGGGDAMGPGGPGTGPASTPADMAASASFGRELSNARQADPAALAKEINDVKMKIGEILSSTLGSNPKVATALSKVLPHFEAAIKAATEAAAALSVATPINASAAAGAPGAGGPNPAPVGIGGMGQF